MTGKVVTYIVVHTAADVGLVVATATLHELVSMLDNGTGITLGEEKSEKEEEEEDLGFFPSSSVTEANFSYLFPSLIRLIMTILTTIICSARLTPTVSAKCMRVFILRKRKLTATLNYFSKTLMRSRGHSCQFLMMGMKEKSNCGKTMKMKTDKERD